jgi:hypothetical protein
VVRRSYEAFYREMQHIEFSGQERLLLCGQFTQRALRFKECDPYTLFGFLASLSISAAVFPLGNFEKNPGKLHLIVDGKRLVNS